MGRIFIQHMGGTRLFSCASCETVLTNRDELISTRCDIQRTASHCNTDLTIIISTQGSLEPPGVPFCSTRWSTSSTAKCRIGWCSPAGTWLGEVIWLSGMWPNILFCNRDVYCKNCDSKLGWMYEFATEDNQRFTTIFIWAWPALYTYVLYNIRQVQRRQSHFGKSSCSRVWWHWGTPHQWLILTNHFCTQYIVKYHFTHNTFCLVSSCLICIISDTIR